MIESASNTSRRRRQVWLAPMRQRDACWVGEVTLKGSRIVSEPAPCGSNLLQQQYKSTILDVFECSRRT